MFVQGHDQKSEQKLRTKNFAKLPNHLPLLSMVTSSWRNVVRGCPQGSVLGPLLCNIFQNDLSYNVDSALSMYADDHQIYEKGRNLCTVLAKLQESATLAPNIGMI